MTREGQSAEATKLRQERDLFLQLLNLAHQSELRPFLKDALALIVEVSGARQGYLELYDDTAEAASWWMAHGFSADELEAVRANISRGIIAEAVAAGQTIVTPSALLDPRFRDRDSVRLGRIEAVLCAPIGQDPPRGVLYLQGAADAGPFATDEDRTRAEVFAFHLVPIVDRLLARQHSAEAVDATKPIRATLRTEGVIGRSPALAAALRQAALVAPLNVNVLISGESGTGKTQLARIIHENGPRVGQPFIEVNCAALPDNLVESELFGALPGAHSTATRRVEGKIAAAEHGTLFLDDIGELSLAAQAKLLQLLQSREYFPLGSSTPLVADVRVIAATNADLQQAVAERRFREDLFYRLQVLPIRMPSLAERRSDIAELAAFACTSACERHRLPRLQLSSAAVRALETAEWPGNVRELAHCLEAAAIRAAGAAASQIELDHLFPQRSAEPLAAEKSLTFQEATRRFQAHLLRSVLEDNGWNISEAARHLDLTRSHIYNLVRAFGLDRSQDRRGPGAV